MYVEAGTTPKKCHPSLSMSRLLVAEFGRKSRRFFHFCPDSFHKSVTRYIQMRIIPEKVFQLVSIRWNICIRSRVSIVICGAYTQKKARFYLQPNQKYGFCTTRKIIKRKKCQTYRQFVALNLDAMIRKTP